jgi:hypothetical protein
VTTGRLLFHVFDPRGIPLGTAFAIAEHVALTCVHVVSGQSRVELRAPGLSIEATVDLAASSFDLDLALLRTESPLPSIWPVEYDWNVGDSLQLSGYQLQAVAKNSPLPTIGRISGSTSVPYQSNGLSFAGHGVLRVENALVEPGLSGGPAILVEDDVVIGVVVSRFSTDGGFVIPFSRVQRDSGLGLALGDNVVRVPRWGRFLNAIALKEAAARYTESVLNDLRKRGHYTRERHVRRSNAADQVLNRVSHGDSVCPIIASSGVGKTYFLAGLVEELRGRYPVLLVRAAAFDFSSLDSLVASATSTSESHIAAVLDRLLSNGTRLIVAIDGLNEAAAPVPEVRRWLLNANRRLGANGVTLIIGCRPEYWSLVEADAGNPRPVRLEWFSDAERDQAAGLYGVEPHNRLFSYPLLLRLAAPTASSSGAPPSVAIAMERYGQLMVRKAALAMEGDLTEGQVWDRLRRLGRAMTGQDDLWLSFAKYEELAAPPPLPAVLIQEGLFQESTAGIRPMFDELAYWMQAKALVAEPIADLLALRQNEFLLPYALATRSAAEVELAVTHTLNLVEAAPSAWSVHRVAFALSQVERLSMSDDSLRRLAEQVLAISSLAVEAIAYLRPLLIADNLTDACWLKLLWYLAPLENEFPFRKMDWNGGLIDRERSQDFPAASIFDDSPHTFAHYAVALVCRSPDAFEQVLLWVGDARPLKDWDKTSKEATVGSWAAAVIVRALARLDTSHLHRTLQFVATAHDDRSFLDGGRMIGTLAEAVFARWPAPVFDFWERNLRDGSHPYVRLIARLAQIRHVNTALTAYDSARWNELRSLAFELADDGTKQALGRTLGPDVPVFEEWLLSSLKAGRWTSSFDGLEEVVSRRGPEFLDAIQPLMRTDPRAHAHVATQVFAALAATLDSQTRKADIVALIQEYWPTLGKDNRYTIALAVERAMSGRTGAGLLDGTIAALSVWMLRQPGDLCAAGVTYGALAAARSKKRDLAAAAIKWFESTADTEPVIIALVYKGPEDLPFMPGWPLIRDAAQRMDHLRDGPSLMKAIVHGGGDWQRQFLQWLKDPTISADADYMLRELREKVLADPGKELFETVVEVVETNR